MTSKDIAVELAVHLFETGKLSIEKDKVIVSKQSEELLFPIWHKIYRAKINKNYT